MLDSENISKKSSLITTLLLLTLGSAGVHRIYAGRYISGIFIFLTKCTYLVTDYLGYKWDFILNIVCFGMLLFDLYGLYSDSFTDGKGKIITDEQPDVAYENEKDRLNQIYIRKCNKTICVLIAIVFYIVYFILRKYVF